MKSKTIQSFSCSVQNEHKICSGGARREVNVRPRGRVNVVEKEVISSQGQSSGRSHGSS